MHCHICKIHAQRSAWEEDKKERLFSQICTWSGDTICNRTIQTFLHYLGTSKQQYTCADLSLILKKTPCRTLKTTRRYQESEGAVMYAAGVEMWRNNLSGKHVDITSAKTIWLWLLLVTLARIRKKLMHLISFVVFPTLLLFLQTFLSYLLSWIQKWMLNITGIHIPYGVNDNHVIVLCHCYMRSFQGCQTVVLL